MDQEPGRVVSTPESTSDSYEREIEKNRRWNFSVNTLDLIHVNLSKSFIFHTTVLPLYASYLTSSGALIGLVPAIYQVGYLLPQLLLARTAEILERKKPFVVRVSIWERVPYLFIALAIFLWPGAPAWFAYLVLVVNIAVATGTAGLASPAWKAMLGKIIRPNRRALLFSLASGVGGFLGIGGALLSRHILNSGDYPGSFGLCFLLAFFAQAVAFFFLTLNREPARRTQTDSPTTGEYLRRLPGILRGDKNFMRYLASQVVVILGTMGVSFYVIYGRFVFGIGDGFAGTLTVVALISQSAGIPLLGWLSDRLGHKWLAEISVIFGTAAVALMLVIPGPFWLYPAFILANLCIVGLRISMICISMEFGGVDRLATYSALSGSILGVPTLLAPVIGGWILDAAGFTTLFAVALLLSVSGWAVLRLFVRDPRHFRA